MDEKKTTCPFFPCSSNYSPHFPWVLWFFNEFSRDSRVSYRDFFITSTFPGRLATQRREVCLCHCGDPADPAEYHEGSAERWSVFRFGTLLMFVGVFFPAEKQNMKMTN